MVIVEWSLTHATDGEVVWSVEVPLEAESRAEPASLPPGATLRGTALLVGWVTLVGPDGEAQRVGLGGRVVESDGSGALVASAGAFTGRSGVGVLHDEHDDVLADDEMPPLPAHASEVTR